MKRCYLLGLVMLVTLGCQTPRWRDRNAGPQAGGYVAPRPPAPVAQGFAPAPPPYGQPNVQVQGPAPSFPTVPPGPGAAPGFAPPGPSNTFPTLPPNPAPNGGAANKFESHWQPAEARTPGPVQSRVLLGPPEPVKDEGVGKVQTKEPAPATPAPATGLPVGIPRFAHVKRGLASGLRPTPDDGLDWLKANDFRTLVRLRLPGENDDADRQLAERRGFRYASLEVAPDLLSKETVDEFLKIVGDPDRQVLFVYDRDGALAGGMWYVWLRLAEDVPDDVARVRARALGLREDGEGAHRAMWQAAQKYVADEKAK